MIPLLFILVVSFLSIVISCQVSQTVTFFTLYMGLMIGLLLSGVTLDFWNRRNVVKQEVS